MDFERIAGLWPAVLDQVRQSGSELLSAVFAAARPVAVDAEQAVLEVGFPPSAAFNKRKAEAQEARERLADAVRTIVGERLRPVYVLLEGDEGAAERRRAGAQRGRADRAAEGRVRRRGVRGGRGKRGGGRTRMPTRGGPGGMDLNAMMKQVQQMQAEMVEAQEKLKDEVVEASAGGGMVKVKMSGDLRLLRDHDRSRGDRPRGRRGAPGHGAGGGQRGAPLGAGAGHRAAGRDRRRRLGGAAGWATGGCSGCPGALAGAA